MILLSDVTVINISVFRANETTSRALPGRARKNRSRIARILAGPEKISHHRTIVKSQVRGLARGIRHKHSCHNSSLLLEIAFTRIMREITSGRCASRARLSALLVREHRISIDRSKKIRVRRGSDRGNDRGNDGAFLRKETNIASFIGGYLSLRPLARNASMQIRARGRGRHPA